MSISAKPRRSARIAANNAVKASSKPSFLILTGPGSQGKSEPFLKEILPRFLKETPSPISDCHIQYVIHPIDSNIQNPEVLKELIARHWERYGNDFRNAAQIYPTMWERELDAASRWFCIDRRILKASPEMYDKAEMFADLINGFVGLLYPQINELEEEIMTLQGMESDHAFRRLLWSKVLLQLAEHAHFKWNIIWNEIGNRKRRCNGCGTRRCRCNEFNCPYDDELTPIGSEPFKPETGWSSDDDW